jgi:hypothetical protein
MQGMLDQMAQLFGSFIPRLLGGIAILILGWFVALFLSGLIRRGLQRLDLDKRMGRWLVAEEGAKPPESARWVSRAFFYLFMLFVLVGFFQALGLTLVTEPLNKLLGQIFEYAPRLLGPALLLLVAWIVASVLKLIVTRAMNAAKIDQRLGSKVSPDEAKPIALAKSVGDAVYWLVFLLFLPAILGSLALEGLLEPVRGMIDKILAFLPNILSAALIVAVGWFGARILQRIVSSLLAAIGIDRLSERAGLAKALGDQKLSGVLGLVVYIMILIPVLIASLNALGLEAITMPASNMLNLILAATPSIFAAILILVVAYVVGRVVAGLIANLLAGLGFNAILARLGLGKEPAEGERTPSQIVGYLVLVAIMLFAVIEALGLLEFRELAELVSLFMVFFGHIVLGLIIFGLGLFLANVASKAVLSSATVQAKVLAAVARIAIIMVAGAMALQQMGLADEIISLAFGLLFGAIAVAAAIAFGIGGRDMAARQLDEWHSTIKSEKPEGD